ncbi:MAG: hypothetical protein Q8Q09_05030 [Deltaproteobacteria bacterium]|nr:hypothetical protein [Deltaproteobacteria bacterium]
MREEAVIRLRKLLRDNFSARYAGVDGQRASRAQGYTDGYMAALLSAGVLTQRELLSLVSEERQRAAGPSTVSLSVRPAAA